MQNIKLKIFIYYFIIKKISSYEKTKITSELQKTGRQMMT